MIGQRLIPPENARVKSYKPPHHRNAIYLYAGVNQDNADFLSILNYELDTYR